jgi:hypothetical protein
MEMFARARMLFEIEPLTHENLVHFCNVHECRQEILYREVETKKIDEKINIMLYEATKDMVVIEGENERDTYMRRLDYLGMNGPADLLGDLQFKSFMSGRKLMNATKKLGELMRR